jgi:multidrug resistance efflux pump
VTKLLKSLLKGEDGQAQNMDIKMPKDGTIVKTDGMEGSMAQAGSPIAYAYNLDDSNM